MPIPFLIAGAALLAGGYGVKKGIDAKRDFSEASDTNENANKIVDSAQKALDSARKSTQSQIEKLGKAKLNAYQNGLTPFVSSFKKLKNVDFKSSLINEEYEFTQETLGQLEKSVNYMTPILLTGAGSLGAGGLAGLAAYGGAGMLAAASTGTPIAALGGVAATNATLAWFGGGALSAGGLGMAGGTAVLGGIVAGPVLAVGGMMLASKAETAKHEAYENLAKAKVAAEEMKSAEVMAKGIGKSFQQVQSIICELMERFEPLLAGLNKAVEVSTDFRSHSEETQKGIMMAATMASTIRNVIEIRLLTDEGTVITDAIESIDNLRAIALEKMA